MVKQANRSRNLRPLCPDEGNWFRRQEKFVRLFIRKHTNGLILIIGMFFLFSGMITYTHAYFRDQAEVAGHTFRAIKIGDVLAVSPGKAQATFPAVGEPSGETPLVASYNASGQLILNFGEVVQGSQRNFNDVLRFENISTQLLTVSWEFVGDISDVVAESKGMFLLASKNTQQSSYGLETISGDVYDNAASNVYQWVYLTGENKPSIPALVYGDSFVNVKKLPSLFSLDVKLNVKPKLPPGTYQGTLSIKVNGNFLVMNIPAKVVVRTKEKVEAANPVSIQESVYSSTYDQLVGPPKEDKNN